MLKSFIIDWNNKWRFDYWYRDKYEVEIGRAHV